MNNVDDMLERLNKSKFRSSFHLRKYMYSYIDEKGLDTIRRHAYELLNNRIKVYKKESDGRQTPMKGHPVFIACHATATCCRSCIEKWYHIPKEKELTIMEVEYFTQIVMKWIEKEYKNRL